MSPRLHSQCLHIKKKVHYISSFPTDLKWVITIDFAISRCCVFILNQHISLRN